MTPVSENVLLKTKGSALYFWIAPLVSIWEGAHLPFSFFKSVQLCEPTPLCSAVKVALCLRYHLKMDSCIEHKHSRNCMACKNNETCFSLSQTQQLELHYFTNSCSLWGGLQPSWSKPQLLIHEETNKGSLASEYLIPLAPFPWKELKD